MNITKIKLEDLSKNIYSGKFDGYVNLIVVNNELVVWTDDSGSIDKEPGKPYHVHDCNECIFLYSENSRHNVYRDPITKKIIELKKHFKRDYYFCKQGEMPTIVVRESSDPIDYYSGLHADEDAYNFCVKIGLIQGEENADKQ